MGWTEERVELLKKLWMEGFSASQIAGELGDGVTRNAVIGKVHRLKLSGRAKPTNTAPRVRTAPRPARRVTTSTGAGRNMGAMLKQRSMVAGATRGATALKMEEDVAPEVYAAAEVQELFIPPEERIGLLDLSEATCKWPIGDPLNTDFYFCGQRSEDGKPYCEFHSRRAYHQLERKRR